MKKTFNFGKIAYNGKRKINTVTVTVEFESGVFTAMGSIYNMTHTNVFCGGQCLDTIAEYIHTQLLRKFIDFGNCIITIIYTQVLWNRKTQFLPNSAIETQVIIKSIVTI